MWLVHHFSDVAGRLYPVVILGKVHSRMENPPEYVEVTTTAGKVRGKWRPTSGGADSARSAAFLGIPFAEPPVGELRFAAPVKKRPWSGVRDALDYGATAQRGDAGVTLIPEPSVEGDSTLNVNVFTPSPEPVEDGTGLPVLVWIHGGAYSAGSPASPWYDGRNFNRDGIVTVSLSYRLGFTGFGWIEGAPQNRGVRDWIAGLEWVRDNISAFGGDPGNVTIAGQSAGGGAVLTLLGMEAAQGLFHRVQALSSPIPDVDPEAARSFAQRLAQMLDVTPDVAGFASIPEEELLQAQEQVLLLSGEDMARSGDVALPVGPTVDGDLIRMRTLEAIAAGVGAEKHLVIGAADDEMSMALVQSDGAPTQQPASEVLTELGIVGRAQSEYLAANEDVIQKGAAALRGRVIGDSVIRVPTFLAIQARGDAPTWVYRFAWASPNFGGAVHCIDVPFFFDRLDDPTTGMLLGPDGPKELADEVHDAAVRFVRSGDPGWVRYTPEHPIVRVWDVPIAEVEDGYASVRPLMQ